MEDYVDISKRDRHLPGDGQVIFYNPYGCQSAPVISMSGNRAFKS